MLRKINKEVFRRYFIAALCNIGVDIKVANLFCVETSNRKLEDLHICHMLSIAIDDFVLKHIPEYKGCLPKDTYADIINYNFDS